MKTSILGIGKLGMKVLEKCRGFADTEYFSCSDEGGVSESITAGEMVLSVTEASPDRSAELSGMLTRAAGLEVLKLELVILPFRGGFTPADYPTADRNVIFLPQTPQDIAGEQEYYDYCVAEAERVIKDLKRLTDSINDINIISFDKYDLTLALDECKGQQNSKFVLHFSGSVESCGEQMSSSSLITADTAALVMMSYCPSSATVDSIDSIAQVVNGVERVCSGFSISDDITEAEVIVLGVNRVGR